jgi:hypothetical protein
MELTLEQKKEIIRVCGENFEDIDIPTFWRNREGQERQAKGAAIEDIERLGAYQDGEGNWVV